MKCGEMADRLVGTVVLMVELVSGHLARVGDSLTQHVAGKREGRLTPFVGSILQLHWVERMLFICGHKPDEMKAFKL